MTGLNRWANGPEFLLYSAFPEMEIPIKPTLTDIEYKSITAALNSILSPISSSDGARPLPELRRDGGVLTL